MKTHLFPHSTLLCAALIPLAWHGTAHAEGVEAGTLIENTATASYEDGDTSRTVDSNTVVLRVDELLDVTATSTDSGAVLTNPGSEVLTFEVTNTGNGPEAFTLTTNPAVAGNDFDATVDGIAVDSNGNGQYDPGIDDILTGPETTAVLDPDASLTVFVLVTVPNTVTDGQDSQIELTAVAETGSGAPGTTFPGEGAGGGDAVVGSGSATSSATGSLLVGIATVNLVKSAAIADPFGGTSSVPGAIITYTITASAEGTGAVDNLIVSDIIPSGTTYVAGSLTLDTNALTDLTDSDAGEGSASGVNVNIGTVPTGTSHSVTFDVTID